jgi:pimeloyl-ACP methyl ester carboxylesterase
MHDEACFSMLFIVVFFTECRLGKMLLFFSLFLIFFKTLNSTVNGGNLTASSETLIWKPLNASIRTGIDSAWEAFILVPVDYEAENSPLIPINIRKFQKSKENFTGTQSNIWFLPGGPGQSSQTLDVYMDLIVPLSPPGAVIYAIDHRGLGKSTPMVDSKESEMLKANDKNPEVLPAILQKKQNQLGLLVPLTRVLRVENVARDLLKGLSMVKSQDQPKKSKNYLLSVSYGTVIARRAVQIEPNVFEAVIFDGLAALEKIEISNEADRALEEFCDMLPNCRQELSKIPFDSKLRIRSVIPEILAKQNQCTQFLVDYYKADSVCQSIHLLLNGALLQGLAILKVAVLRALFEMNTCVNYESFTYLIKSLDQALRRRIGGNALQSVAIMNPGSAIKVSSSLSKTKDTEQAVSVNEFVFEVISALERYHITPTSIDICFNKKHYMQGDESRLCPSRLFDPCRFFQTTYERKSALADSIGELPNNSIVNPIVRTDSTRLIVLAGLLDFNTPTMLAREIFNQFFISPEKQYYQFNGLSHGVFGSSGCEKEIFNDFLNGGNRTTACSDNVNSNHKDAINNRFFGASLDVLAYSIDSLS